MPRRSPTTGNLPTTEALRHRLRDHFKDYTDDLLIQELDAFQSALAWATATLQPTASALREDQTLDLHLILPSYLRTHRPGVLARAERLAENLAPRWPLNHSKLDFFARSSAWRNMVRARFTRRLRERFHELDSKAWVDLIWPQVLHLLKNEPDLRNASPSTAATTILIRLCVPTNPKHQGKSVYKDILKELRGRLKALRAQPG